MKTEHSNQNEDFVLVEQPHVEKIKRQVFSPKPQKERALRVIQDSSEMIDASNKDIKQLYQDLIFVKEGNFKCTVCEKTMGHKGSMERHVETHMTGLSYDCKHCGEKIRSREALKNHLRNNPQSSRWSTSCRSRKMLADHTFKLKHWFINLLNSSIKSASKENRSTVRIVFVSHIYFYLPGLTNEPSPRVVVMVVSGSCVSTSPQSPQHPDFLLLISPGTGHWSGPRYRWRTRLLTPQ